MVNGQYSWVIRVHKHATNSAWGVGVLEKMDPSMHFNSKPNSDFCWMVYPNGRVYHKSQDTQTLSRIEDGDALAFTLDMDDGSLFVTQDRSTERVCIANIDIASLGELPLHLYV